MINITARYYVICEFTLKTTYEGRSDIKHADCFHQNKLFLKADAGILVSAWFPGPDT